MSDDMTIRDPYEMEKFADRINEYCTEMRIACTDLQTALSIARSGMKDGVSTAALQRLDQLAEELMSGLPDMGENELILRKSAAPLKQALDL